MLTNVLIGIVIIGVTVTIHGYGTFFWFRLLSAKSDYLTEQSFNTKMVWVLIFTALFLLLLNFLEAIVWGLTYYILPNVTEFESLEKSIYFSLVTFTTLGYGDITISSTNRILSGFEAMNGIMLLGWSTTVLLSVMQFIAKNTFSKEAKNEKK